MKNNLTQNTIDPLEIEKFTAMADEWWDPTGKFKPLHMMNATRFEYIVTQIKQHFMLSNNNTKPLQGLRILDIGCGGGLLSEPIFELGATVVGADAALANIHVAQIHASNNGLSIDYRNTTVEELVQKGEQFDVVLNMEVIEHVLVPEAFIKGCGYLLKNGGLMLCSTINRNIKSYIMAIIGAERIMRWLPIGTHDWHKFITPNELQLMIQSAGLSKKETKGFTFNPLNWGWSISINNYSVNYVMAVEKR